VVIEGLAYTLFKLYSRVVGIIQTAYTRANVDTLQADLVLCFIVADDTLPTYCCLKILLGLRHPFSVLKGLFR